MQTVTLLIAWFALACASAPIQPPASAPPARDVVATLWLVGDAGAADSSGDAVLIALLHELRMHDDTPQRRVVFLGDNIYWRGMPPEGDDERSRAEQRALAQVEVATQSGVHTIFLAGNHDWAHSSTNGAHTVQRQEAFLETNGEDLVEFLPNGACPGPAVHDVNGEVRLVVLDTQWWLFEETPIGPDTTCALGTKPAILASLGSAIAGAAGRPVIVVGHHPILTGGPHGGHFTWKEHLFPLREWKSWLWIPLPVIGSLYPIARQNGITQQDVSGSRYDAMRTALDSVFRAHRPVLYAAGHEHGLQVLDGGDGAYSLAVSGAGNFGHVSDIARLDETRFVAHQRSGYMRVDVQRDGRVRLAVVVVDAAGGATEAYADYLNERP